MDDPATATLARLAALLAAGELDAVALAEESLARARRAADVFITITHERALDQARRAHERRRRRVPAGPLDGLPIAWKDLFDIAGTRTTAGSLTRAALPPAERDAGVVENAHRVGLVTVGKTNLTEFAFSGLGLNPHFGTPAIESREGLRVPGGSSSGSARAVALGIVPAAIGTDTAGSVRIPAAFNGLVGFKTSPDRYPRRGLSALAPSFDSIGPIARSVEDCALLDMALRGSAAPAAQPLELARATLLADQALLEEPTVAAAVRDNLLAALARLERAGARVRIEPVPALAEVRAVIEREGWPGGIEAFVEHEAVLTGPQAERIDPRVRERLVRAGTLPAANVVRLHRSRLELKQRIAADLDGAVLVLPTVACTAPLLAGLADDAALFASVNLAVLRLTMLTSFLAMPSLALPSGSDAQQLCTSLQLCLPEGEDERLLRFGLAVERVLGSAAQADCR